MNEDHLDSQEEKNPRIHAFLYAKKRYANILYAYSMATLIAVGLIKAPWPRLILCGINILLVLFAIYKVLRAKSLLTDEELSSLGEKEERDLKFFYLLATAFAFICFLQAGKAFLLI